ncbi:lysophospholipase catalytic domain-containing protein [Apiospora rasikravindrae]|uniref:Lysophospholipase n=1 Tax=Apiospora rasikravindrae TaxID=990691 RepID=A0ABR1RNW3_9PEZI
MHSSFSLLSLASLALASPSLVSVASDVEHVVHRALPDSPSGGYAPAEVKCPSTRPTVRSAHNISQQESDWLRTRRGNTVQPMIDFLRGANIADFDAQAYINNHRQNLTALPNVGIALSGGGYRALMNGAGFVAAADSRVAGSTDQHGIGGLLQSATYLAGLSGGGWLVGSIYANNFSTVPQLRDGSPGSDLWQFSRSILKGPKESGISILNTASYWDDVHDAVNAKRDAGYEASITDYWGRTLSYQLINAKDGGPSYTFSSISRTPGFNDAQQPLPILVADGRLPNELVVALNSTVYEFNPWEMGTFDPSVFGFVPLQYLGSNFSAGAIPDNERCMSGFDQYGYVMGTSSSLFNQIALRNISSEKVPNFVTNAIEGLLERIGKANDDIAVYSPNPFYRYNEKTNPSAEETTLTLVDGGEDLQNMPLHPLIQPERALDVIFAVDSSADTDNNFPNGTALRATYDRTAEPISNGTRFPVVPDAETFINKGLNQRPTFFGCDPKNYTTGGRADGPMPPLIVYVPLMAYTAWGNVSTFTMSYDDADRNAIIQNGFNVATMGNGTTGDMSTKWRTCIGCAVLQRSMLKTNATVPAACQECFKSHCWDGTTDSRPIAGGYTPNPVIGIQETSAGVSSRAGDFNKVLGLMSAVAASGLALAI